MLARVTTGKSGIVEYLENGLKSGREMSRDELDLRVCLEGDLNLTDKVIDKLKIKNKSDNYFHITLSFTEKELSTENIAEAYHQYKNKLMSAYKGDEFNIYAETVSVNIVAIIYCYQAADFACSVASSDGLLI